MPQLKRAFKVVAIATWGFCAQASTAQTTATKPDSRIPSSCPLPGSPRIVGSMRELPDIAAAFARAELDIADVGERFIPFDVEDRKSEGLPHRQFVRAYVVGDRVIVWYFHGGFGTHFHVVELRYLVSGDSEKPVLHVMDGSLSGSVCVATQALLNGVSVGDEQ